MFFPLQEQSLSLGKKKQSREERQKNRSYFGFSHWKNKTQLIVFCSDVLLESVTCLVTTETGPETEKVNS